MWWCSTVCWSITEVLAFIHHAPDLSGMIGRAPRRAPHADHAEFPVTAAHVIERTEKTRPGMSSCRLDAPAPRLGMTQCLLDFLVGMPLSTHAVRPRKTRQLNRGCQLTTNDGLRWPGPISLAEQSGSARWRNQGSLMRFRPWRANRELAGGPLALSNRGLTPVSAQRQRAMTSSRPRVEASPPWKPSGFATAPASSPASFLPSSTPHWSKAFTPQTTLSTNTLCS